jgi:hypothetical protein
MLYHDMGWADDFKVNYNGILLNPLSIHHESGSSAGIYFTIEINGTVETWRLFYGYSEIDDSIRTRTTKISSIPVGGGEIDTSSFATKEDLYGKQNTIADLADIRAGAALGATALQSVPAGYVTSAMLGQEITNVENQITGVAATIPQKTSQLNNDSGFTTEEYVNTQVRTAIISALNTEV